MESPQPNHPLLDSAPQFLRDWPMWAAWSAPQKRPLDLRRRLKPASTTDPDTWATFADAQAHLARLASVVTRIPHTAGVGILIARPLAFIDLDDVPDPHPQWVLDLITQAQRVGAYVERSASGEGIHVLVRAMPGFPVLTRNRWTRPDPKGSIGIEVYQHARFCALTGVVIGTPRPALNEPEEGDALLKSFITTTAHSGAPILSKPTPIEVPHPNERIRQLAETLLTPSLAGAIASPEYAYGEWQKNRQLKSMDDSKSAWRFALYTEASRRSPISPQPVYEFFFPKLDPVHANIGYWQDFSGANAKPHRKYADIQRAHALVVEEARLLAMDLGEPPPPLEPEHDERPSLNLEQPGAQESWAALGLVMRRTQEGGVRPLPTSVNFIRCIQRHSFFKQWRIERNQLDGTTRVNRVPIADTVATRMLEPLRAVMDMPRDPPIQAVRDAIEVIADDNPYDPLAEYLDALPKWSPPSTDNAHYELLSTWLTEIGAQKSHDIEKFARRILVGLVARAKRPGVKFDYVPVFEGPTGVGKSTLVSHIVTPEFYGVLKTDLLSKDAVIVLKGKWGVEMAEMNAFRKSDEETRKSFFSTAADTFRPPYGRASITVPRRTVLFGTTEDRQYLTDHRGNRRYWPISFPKPINLKWFEEHRDELFAEALYAFEQGEVFHDTVAEFNSIERRREMDERLATPAWQLRIIDHLKSLPVPHLPTKDEPGFAGYLSTKYVAELQRVLDLPNAVQSMSDAQLASFLRRAGYTQSPLSYRSRNRSTKTYGWAHPAFLRLTDDQMKGFLACFPSLFDLGVTPPHWDLLKEEHLEDALRILSEEE